MEENYHFIIFFFVICLSRDWITLADEEEKSTVHEKWVHLYISTISEPKRVLEKITN